jgi:hypothetical protein
MEKVLLCFSKIKNNPPHSHTQHGSSIRRRVNIFEVAHIYIFFWYGVLDRGVPQKLQEKKKRKEKNETVEIIDSVDSRQLQPTAPHIQLSCCEHLRYHISLGNIK